MSVTKKCGIKGCSTYATMGIPMHHFPQKEELLLKWLDALKEANISEISVHTVICGLHFKLSDYKDIESKRRRLKAGAVPSRHLSHDHILDDEYFSEQGFSEEEVDANAKVTQDNNTSEICEEVTVTAGELFMENDDVYDRASDIQKLMSIEASVDKNIMCMALESFEKEIETVEEDVGIDGNTADKEVQAYVFTADIAVQVNSNTANVGVQTAAYSFLDFLKTDNDLQAFTGINYDVLHSLVESAKLILNKASDRHLCSLEERIVLTLCKLRLGLSFQCLAVLFKIGKTTACNYFEETIHLLACILEEAIYFPDKEEIQQNLPICFNEFQETRIILDCTEMAVQNSKCLQCRLKMYSHYKGRLTLKILIGITPSGLISYCSKCYGGRASDKSIFLHSGLLKKMIPGQDAIMVDKGFMIKSECDERKIKLIRPPFADKTSQMSEEDSLQTRSIAAARVHVERSIQRLKNFAILKSTLQWDMTKYFDEIMIIICGIVNLGSPILDKCRF